MTFRMLEGVVAENVGDMETADLRAELRTAREEIRELRAQLVNAEKAAIDARAATMSMAAVQRQLSPLYRALQMLFGELDAVVGEGGQPSTEPATAGSRQDARISAIWETWKRRLGPQCAKIIDALMLQPMNTTQLAIAIATHRNNIAPLIYKMNKAGLIDKNGGKFALKQL